MKKQIEIPEQLFRSATIEVCARADGEPDGNEMTMSISSDTPYKRYDYANDEDYYEVLDHGSGGCDDSRLKAGLPILFNHNANQPLGTATNYANDGKKITVSGIKWGSSQFAKDMQADAKSGALRNTSVGYRITDDGECVGALDGIPIYKFKWAPHEASLAPVPADITVGVGRGDKPAGMIFRSIGISHQKDIDNNANVTQKHITAQTTAPKNTSTPKHMAPETPAAPVIETPKVNVVAEREDAIKVERKRIAEVQDLEKHICEKGVFGRKVDPSAIHAISARMIAEGKRVEDFQGELMRSELPELKPITTSPDIGASQRDISKYSLIRAMNGALGQFNRKKWEGLEREMHDATTKQLGRESNGGFFVPNDVMAHRALSTNVFTGAGALVQAGPQGQSMIELYRNQMKVVKMGARTLSGLVGNLAIPAQTGGATAYWLPENGTITATDQTVGQVALTPQRLGAATAFTLQLLAQTDNPDIENFVREDLMKVLALAKDKAALVGAGSAGEPLGIYNTSGLSTSVTLANAGTMTYAEALRFELNVANNNADVGSLGYLTTPTVRAGTKATAEISASNANPVWKGGMVNGYPADATLQITSAGTVFFGNWADLIIGDWAGQEIIVDPYSLSLQGQVRIVMQQLTSVALRHAKSFSVSTN